MSLGEWRLWGGEYLFVGIVSELLTEALQLNKNGYKTSFIFDAVAFPAVASQEVSCEKADRKLTFEVEQLFVQAKKKKNHFIYVGLILLHL